MANIGLDTSICLNEAPFFLTSVFDDPVCRYQWSTGDTTATITVKHYGAYGISITNQHGCTSIDTVTVGKSCYINIPNVFTPNSDGMNDYFFPRQLLTKNIRYFICNCSANGGR